MTALNEHKQWERRTHFMWGIDAQKAQAQRLLRDIWQQPPGPTHVCSLYSIEADAAPRFAQTNGVRIKSVLKKNNSSCFILPRQPHRNKKSTRGERGCYPGLWLLLFIFVWWLTNMKSMKGDAEYVCNAYASKMRKKSYDDSYSLFLWLEMN